MLGRISRSSSVCAGRSTTSPTICGHLDQFSERRWTALVAGDADAARDRLAHALEEADRVSASSPRSWTSRKPRRGRWRWRESVGLAGVVDEALSLYADEADDKAIALRSNVPGDLHVIGDRTRLRQVLANVIENAVGPRDAIVTSTSGPARRTGFVTLTVTRHRRRHQWIRTPHVSDRLIGTIRRTTRGLGLGLSLVKAVVEAHGGHVGVSSVARQGSTFSVSLPIALSRGSTVINLGVRQRLLAYHNPIAHAKACAKLGL